MQNHNGNYDPDEQRAGASSGTKGFVIGALAAAAFIVLMMAVLKTGVFGASEPAEPLAVESGASVPE